MTWIIHIGSGPESWPSTALSLALWSQRKKKYANIIIKTKFIKDNITLLDYFPLSPHLLIPFYNATDIHVYTMPFLVDIISLLLNQQSSYSWNMYIDRSFHPGRYTLFLLDWIIKIKEKDSKKRSFDVRITHARPPLSIAIGVQKISNCKNKKWNGLNTLNKKGLSPCQIDWTVQPPPPPQISTRFEETPLVRIEWIAVKFAPNWVNTIRNKAELNPELGDYKLLTLFRSYKRYSHTYSYYLFVFLFLFFDSVSQ